MAARIVTIGTRGSPLALAQSNEVIGLLKAGHPDIAFELVIIRTAGDADRSASLEAIGGTGVFTRKIESELLAGNIDLAVHSAKDLPAQMTGGLTIAAVPPRGLWQDAWVSSRGQTLSEMEPGKLVGTGSPRRRAQLKNLRPDLRVGDIRGNVETRLKKLASGEFDAIIVAQAGLLRLGLQSALTESLSPRWFLPAAGQGALIVQANKDDSETLEMTGTIDNPDARRCLFIERALLRELDAGCSAAVGGWARLEDGEGVRLSAVVLDREGQKRLFASDLMTSDQSDEELAEKVASSLISQGAMDLMDDRKDD